MPEETLKRQGLYMSMYYFNSPPLIHADVQVLQVKGPRRLYATSRRNPLNSGRGTIPPRCLSTLKDNFRPCTILSRFRITLGITTVPLPETVTVIIGFLQSIISGTLLDGA